MLKKRIFSKELFKSLHSPQRNYVKAKLKCMKSWQILEYGGVNKLVLSESAPMPHITRPSDVLVEVKAASVNPIDNKLISGYGSAAIREVRRISACDATHAEFPLTPGRDFSGAIVDRGAAVEDSLKLNDEVWGTVNVTRQGAFSQFILVSSNDIWHKPPSLLHTEAASIPYVASTVWSSLSPLCRRIQADAFQGKKVLVLGGSGGVGTFAIQFLKAYGAEVTTTVACDFVSRASDLGADNVVDYRKADAAFLIGAHGRYDLMLDLVNSQDRSSLLKHLQKSPVLSHPPRYITINFPFFDNVTRQGLVLGALASVSQMALEFVQGVQHGGLVTWGAYAPSRRVLQAAFQLVREHKLQPVLERVYPFMQLPEAMSKVAAGHNRGKTVIDFEL